MTSSKIASAKAPKAWDADKWDGTGTSLIVSTSVWRWPHFGYENDGTSAVGPDDEYHLMNFSILIDSTLRGEVVSTSDSER